MSSMRIGFFLFCKFHKPILQPIYDLLRTDLECFSGGDAEKMIAGKPDIIVCADHPPENFRDRLPGTIVVWTRHGFSTKKYLRQAMGLSDFTCLTSEWVRDDALRRGWRSRLGLWVTGYPPMDVVFRKEADTNWLPENFRRGAPVALYAPTFTPRLNAQEVLGNHWFAAARQRFPDLRIVIKPHPHTPKLFPHWMDEWKAIMDKDPLVWLVDDINRDVYSMLPATSMLITDVSSVMFFYLALDRPIILVSNPERVQNTDRFDPDGYEWAWRDMGREVENENGLLQAIEAALTRPEENAERRAFYRERVFGRQTDGNASLNIANKVRALVQPGLADQEWVSAAWNKIRGNK